MSTAEIIAELPRLSRAELAEVQARLTELVEPIRGDAPANPTAAHPALGIWKNRTDLPADPVEASAVLRDRMLRRPADFGELGSTELAEVSRAASPVESADGAST